MRRVVLVAAALWVCRALGGGSDVVQKVEAATEVSLSKERELIQRMGESAIGVLMDPAMRAAERSVSFQKILVENFDLEGIGRYLVGEDNFRKFTPSEQEEYERLLPGYIVKIYLSKFEEYRGNGLSKENFKIQRAFQRGAGKASGVSVMSVIEPPQKGGGQGALKVEWRVFDTARGPKILDVYVDGLSMSQAKRDEFRSLIRGGGVQTLLAELRKKVEG